MIQALDAGAAQGAGERQLAERLEAALPDDYLVWRNVPFGPKGARPAYVLLHPARGLLLLETRPWKRDLIQHATREYWELLADGRNKVVISPAAQARLWTMQGVQALERDPQLVETEGRHRGRLAFPWGFGVALTGMSRRQFEAAGLGNVMPAHLALCQDELAAEVPAEAFQRRIDAMFSYGSGRRALSPQQRDRVRWILFPDARVQSGRDEALPERPAVLDVAQEQLARGLEQGHRVIHGVAGSGKTLILCRRAEQLACRPGEKPVLVLCRSEPLAASLRAGLAAGDHAPRLQVHSFAQWCEQQLAAHRVPVPAAGPGGLDKMVDALERAVERRQLPVEQYEAVLVDEGHEFAPRWLQLVAQMADTRSNQLLVLCDRALGPQAAGFDFRRMGIQAGERTSLLGTNYRSPRPLLEAVRRVADGVLQPDADAGPAGAPLLQPASGGRDGPPPEVFRVPSRWDEAFKIADQLAAAHAAGHAWRDMAILCRRPDALPECSRVLAARGLPRQVCEEGADYDPAAEGIRLMPMQASKGLDFAVVALQGVGQMPERGEDPADEARLFYLAATRAKERLVVTASEDGPFVRALAG